MFSTLMFYVVCINVINFFRDFSRSHIVGFVWNVMIDGLIYLCMVDCNKYQIQIPLPPKIDPSVTMMTVEENTNVTNNYVGGFKEQIE